MRISVAHLTKTDTFKRFFLARLEWLIRGWFYAAGMWTMVLIGWLFNGRPEIAADLIAKVGTL